jgi:hypothetical protein
MEAVDSPRGLSEIVPEWFDDYLQLVLLIFLQRSQIVVIEGL